eukprot:c1602_g1_i2.p1 GENE.c1602_g1_i2~~c1602_g1_i2.p1  ORF type:complete len:386 (+),score=81.49 c1602_g1_i2:64-1158(+)
MAALISLERVAEDFLRSIEVDVMSIDKLTPGKVPPRVEREVHLPPPFGFDAVISEFSASMANLESLPNPTVVPTALSSASVGIQDFMKNALPTHRFTLCDTSRFLSNKLVPTMRCSVIKFNTVKPTADRRAGFVANTVTFDCADSEDSDDESEHMSCRPWWQSSDGLGPVTTAAPYRGHAAGGQYRPGVLDDPEMKRSSRHSVIRTVGLVASVIPFVSDKELKSQLNEQFRTRFPQLNENLSLSKIRRIKDLLFGFAVEQNIDMSTVALAFVYFEKLVLQGKVDKQNRRLVAGCCMLLANKLNEENKISVQNLSRAIGLERSKALVETEFQVFLDLGFRLRVDDSETEGHYELLMTRVTKPLMD